MKTVTITGFQLLVALDALGALVARQDLPEKTSYRLGRNHAAVEAEVKLLEKAQRKVCERFYRKNPDGTFVRIPKQTPTGEVEVYDVVDREAMNDAVEAMQAEPVKVEIRPIAYADLMPKKKDGPGIPPLVFARLDWMIEGGPEGEVQEESQA
jgi:hypothetical protein